MIFDLEYELAPLTIRSHASSENGQSRADARIVSTKLGIGVVDTFEVLEAEDDTVNAGLGGDRHGSRGIDPRQGGIDAGADQDTRAETGWCSPTPHRSIQMYRW